MSFISTKVPYAIVRFLTVIGGGPSFGNIAAETGFPSEALMDGCVMAISVCHARRVAIGLTNLFGDVLKDFPPLERFDSVFVRGAHDHDSRSRRNKDEV